MTATFRVWAPFARTVHVDSGGERRALAPAATPGWWEASVPAAGPGDDYAFLVDGRGPFPDPRSPWQPSGVHGPSRLVDQHAFRWTDTGWRGRPLPGAVIYELHIGTFTPEGTFAAAAERLDHLVGLGVDFVEVLPVNAFPGRNGWGYDGVGLYAVHEPYGGPDGFKAFVDACHAHGIGVILDVVYNHLGPSGNYLPEFGPYFTERYRTPWGPAVNLDDALSGEVRAFFIDNAEHWFRHYHVDGLRLDAVHALVDTSATHFLVELRDTVDRLAAHLGRTLCLIAESDLNDPVTVLDRDAGGHGMDAQWSDDFHHALHAYLTGERNGYYADFGSLRDIATALRQGFVFTGQHSQYRGRRHGAPLPRSVDGHRLLGYLQDHDQVGNRAAGDRPSVLMSTEMLKVGAALVLTAPFTPMLFMGEEWGATTPWQFFTDHEEPEIAEATRAGRQTEFASFAWDPEAVPDPQDPTTYERSRLDWAELDKDPHISMLTWYRELIELRRTRPELTDGTLHAVDVSFDVDEEWLVLRRASTAVVCNFANDRQRIPLSAPATSVLLASQPGFVFGGLGVEIAGASVAILTLI